MEAIARGYKTFFYYRAEKIKKKQTETAVTISPVSVEVDCLEKSILFYRLYFSTLTNFLYQKHLMLFSAK